MAFLVRFAPDHLSRLDVKDDAKDAAANPNMIPALEKYGHTLLLADGRPLAIIGAVPLLPGVCEVFVLASKLQDQFPVSFARPVRRLIFTLRKEYRRIQAVSKTDNFHYRWLSWLGFRAEGVLKSYGLNGEDMIMWGLTE